MIIHKLVLRYLRHKDDKEFYLLQADDTVRWLDREGIDLGAGNEVLDLGCGHGILGGEILKKGCHVTFADETNYLLPEYADADFRTFDIDKDDIGALGTYDLVICSNVLEHLPRPQVFADSVHRILNPGGMLYLSFTNWQSPWGGHEYSPFHYLGARHGHLVYDRLIGRQRIHTPFVNLFPTSIRATIRSFRGNTDLRLLKVIPRYYTELAFVTRIPLVREFLTWNCVILLQRESGRSGSRINGEIRSGESTDA